MPAVLLLALLPLIVAVGIGISLVLPLHQSMSKCTDSIVNASPQDLDKSLGGGACTEIQVRAKAAETMLNALAK